MTATRDRQGFPEIPGYRIERTLGRAGRLPLYAARRAADDTAVVVKIIAGAPADGVERERFRREIRILEVLRQRNVIPILDHGTFGDGAFLVMPALPQGSLRERIGKLTTREALGVARALTDALAAAHAAGVVHRNLKPENVLFDAEGAAVLADFGLARATGFGKTLTGAGDVVGNARYMSPEQIRDLPTDARSDLYSLGVLLFEMLAGYPPFREADFLSVALQHVGEPLPALEGVDAPVALLVSRLCEKEPAARPPDAIAVRAVIDALM